jgi:hypothetical protein
MNASRLLIALAAVVIAVPASGVPVEAQFGRAGPQVARIWIEGQRDYFRRGDRADLRFSVSDDAYVAVVHVDSDGNLEFLYPASPWDNEYVRGRTVHYLPVRGSAGAWAVRGRPGIGYFFLVASPSPLEFEFFRGFSGRPWDWGYAGHSVRGDPFLAFQQITRLLVPGWPYAPHVVDYHSYYVEGIHRYPAYACSSQAYSYGWGWTPTYGSCSRLDFFLREHPYYFDTFRYRGDRRMYLRDFDTLDPLHGFKESPGGPARGVTPNDRREELRDGGAGDRRPGEIERRVPAGSEGQRPAQPSPGASGSVPGAQRAPPPAPASPGRDRPAPATGGAAPAPGRGTATAAPGRRPAPGRP